MKLKSREMVRVGRWVVCRKVSVAERLAIYAEGTPNMLFVLQLLGAKTGAFLQCACSYFFQKEG